jgi:HPt (histidine-containing phosphotransfer) domain-containing protein
LVKFRVHDNQGSAGKPETHSLHYLELTEVLKHYLNPLVVDNFRKIFTPDTLEQMYIGREKTVLDTEVEKFLTYCLKGTDMVDSELAAFFIAVLAFWVDRPSHRNFCFQILYQLPDSQKLVQNLSDKFSLDFYTFLIKLAKHQDIFGVVNQAKIHGQLHSANQGLEHLHSHIHQLEKELEQSQSQVHQSQAELEQLLNQLHKPLGIIHQSPTNSYYKFIVEKAAYAYYKDDRELMAQYLNQSRKYTSLLPTEIALNWVKIFNQFFAGKGSNLDIESLTNSQEWKKLIHSLVKENLEAINKA